MELQKEITGKKIVFVHPPDLVSKHLLVYLIDREYEVYTLLDHTKVGKVHSSYPGTLFFLNIDAAMKEFEWEDFITKLQVENPGLQLGIFSFKITEAARIQHYIMDLGVNCGFIQLKQGVNTAANMMIKVLQANEVKGRRKYIRYQCTQETAIMNFKLDDILINGFVQDISSVGMSFFLEEDKELVKNQMIKNIQLRLKGVLVNTDGVVLGLRDDNGKKLYVILFNGTDQQKTKDRVHSYIYSSLQKEFDREFS
ncbi:MAG: hypothetical protein B6241_12035 [Spirochaetaceae bacterium 4572_59]|nr:MAG: hypothetical protein B6241_12035 [Spirochaetaceae bacterium 4572_59]